MVLNEWFEYKKKMDRHTYLLIFHNMNLFLSFALLIQVQSNSFIVYLMSQYESIKLFTDLL
jgi:uncharacterized membrane protein YidH (DUF202 family)